MFIDSWLLIAASLIAVSTTQQITPSADDPTRASRIATLRAQADDHIRQQRLVFSEEEFRDIEARYRSAHQQDYPMLLKLDAVPILRELVTRYPQAHRSGCAVLDLARLASGEARERYLQDAIANHNDAWCESGVQVGALARARLAIHYTDQQRLEDAERLAKELVTLFPDAIDDSGALLNAVLRGVQLLK